MRTTRKALAVLASVFALLLTFALPAGATSWSADTGPVSHYAVRPLWTQQIPSTAPVSPDNAFFVSWEKANEPFDWWRIRGVSGNPYGEPFGVGHCADPVFKFDPSATLPSGQGWLTTVGFHAPQAVFTHMVANSDEPFVVLDLCANSARPKGASVWGANVRYDGTFVLKTAAGTGGNLTGGSYDFGTNGLDSKNPATTAAPGVNQISRGRPPDTMLLRDYLLTHPISDGTLGYSPEAFFVETNSSAGFQSPMVGNESGKVGCGGAAHPTICAEGQFVRINPAKVFPVGCTGPALVLAKTLQLHGAYIGDNSGSGSGFKGEQGSTVLTQDSLSACMTLDDLQILAKGYVP